MKNLKKLILATLAVSVSTTFFGCSFTTPTTQDTPAKEEVKISPKSISFEWQNAYEEKLKSFRSSDQYSADSITGSRFDLFDITGDNIPELIISPDNQSQTTCKIYSTVGGQLVELGETGNSGIFYYLPELKLIKDEYLGSGFVIGKYISYKENEFSTLISYNDNSMSASSGASIYYKINGEDVLLPEYDAALEPYRGSVCVEAGRKYTLGDKSLVYALKCSESWGAVLIKHQKVLYNSKLTELLNSMPENNYAFELCDLNGDEVSELIISNGTDESSTCEIYYYENDELKRIDGTFGSFGHFTFDTDQFVLSSGATRWSINNSNFSVDTYKFSDSLAEIGRKYLLTEQNITIALN